METKAALEETVKLHRKSVQGARSIEAEIEVGGAVAITYLGSREVLGSTA